MNLLSLETCEKLRDLGAFKDREWQVGDWTTDGIILSLYNDRAFMHEGQCRSFPLLKDLVFRPRLESLLDEIDRISMTNGGFPTELQWREKEKCFKCIAWTTSDCYIICAEGKTRLEAAAACLIAILERGPKEAK